MNIITSNFTINKYTSEKAVLYALKYGLTPNSEFRYLKSYGDGGGNCTNFVSQCLAAGGAAMDFTSSRPWWYKKNIIKNNNVDSWSLSWTVANSLYWCLRGRYEQKMPGLQGIEVEDIDMLDAGDIIQYENNKRIIYHSAIVTGFSFIKGKRMPLITQNSINAINIPYLKDAAVKNHYMKIVVT